MTAINYKDQLVLLSTFKLYVSTVVLISTSVLTETKTIKVSNHKNQKANSVDSVKTVAYTH